jgi:hypothetical protein
VNVSERGRILRSQGSGKLCKGRLGFSAFDICPVFKTREVLLEPQVMPHSHCKFGVHIYKLLQKSRLKKYSQVQPLLFALVDANKILLA